MSWCRLGIFLFFFISSVSAQAELEVVVPGTVLKNRILPALIRQSSPVIEAQLKEKLDEINQGFTRQQIIEVSLYDLIEESQEDVQNFIKKFSSNREEWNQLIEKMKLMKVRATVNLKILPEAEKLSVTFKNPAQSRALVSFDGVLTSRPKLSIEEVIDLQIIEADLETGEERRIDLSESLQASLKNSFAFQMPSTTFSLSGQIVENLDQVPKEDEPSRPLLVELVNWKSTFKDVYLGKEDVEKILSGTFKGESFFELKKALSSTDAFKSVLTKSETRGRNLVERDVKAYLDQKTADIILWVEKVGAQYKVHISPADKEDVRLRIESARSENRLLLEATSTIPLRSSDLKIRYDDDKKSASVEFSPEAIFSPAFKLKSVHLPKDWQDVISDPLVSAIAAPLYATNLAETQNIDVRAFIKISGGSAKINVPVEWVNGAPQWQSQSAKVSLDFLDQTEVEDVSLDWAKGKSIAFNFKSKESLPQQFFRQIEPVLNAHEDILGIKFFENARDQLFQMAEREILATSTVIPKTPTSPGFNLSINNFALSRDGAIHCRYEAPKAEASSQERFKMAMGFPGSNIIPWQTLNEKGILDIECELELPRTIGLLLSNVQDEEGNVSSIKFNLEAPVDAPKPMAKMKWRLLRDKETDVLIAAPVDIDVSDALAKYQIPSSGEGAPQIGYVQASGIKGVLATGVKGAATIWTYVVAPRTRSIQQTNEGLLVHLGGSVAAAAGSAFVRGQEVKTVDELLRKGVEKYKRDLPLQLKKILSEKVNGDLKSRFQLGAQRNRWSEMSTGDWMNSKPTRHIYYSQINPMTVDYGLLGLAENQLKLRLNEFKAIAPLGKPIGPVVIQDNQTLKSMAEEEVTDTTQQTLDHIPGGVTEVSELISNPTIQKQVGDIRQKAGRYLTDVISKKWKEIETAVVSFIRERSDETKPSPREALENFLGEKILSATNQETTVTSEMLRLPSFCGVSVVKSQINDVDDVFYSVIPKIKDPQQREANQNSPQHLSLLTARPAGSPKLSDLLATVGQDGAIPLGISTDLLDRVINDPENIERLERALEAVARDKGGVSEEFKVDLSDIKVRMAADGQPVIRVSLSVFQPSQGFEKLTKPVVNIIGFLPDLLISGLAGKDVRAIRGLGDLPGKGLDLVTSGIQVIDGSMQFEIPFNASMGDMVHAGSDRPQGHYLMVWAEPSGFRVLTKGGWKSLFGGIAQGKLETNIEDFSHTAKISTPLSIPGFEDQFVFSLGNDYRKESDVGRKTILPMPSVRDPQMDSDGLYKGSLQIRGQLIVKDEAQGYPSFEVTRTPGP